MFYMVIHSMVAPITKILFIIKLYIILKQKDFKRENIIHFGYNLK